MKEIYKKIGEIQQSVPSITKSKKGYGYNYAPLDAILSILLPMMRDMRLAYSQVTDESDNLVTTVFDIESGEFLQSKINLRRSSLQYIDTTKIDKNTGKAEVYHVVEGFEKMNMVQAEGSLMTYNRRYQIAAIFGLVTEEDIDGNPANTTKQAVKSSAPATSSGKVEYQGISYVYKKGVSPKNNKEYEMFKDVSTGQDVAIFPQNELFKILKAKLK